MEQQQKRWFVAHTKPQFERKVHEQLGKWYGIESWCPVVKTKRQWSDRVKVLEVPLFRSYVFVRVTEKERIEALSLDGVIKYVAYLGKAAVIKDQDMAELQEFIEKYKEIHVQPIAPGKSVVISKGVFEGQEGIVQKVINDKKVVLDMPQLGCRLEASIESLETGQ